MYNSGELKLFDHFGRLFQSLTYHLRGPFGGVGRQDCQVAGNAQQRLGISPPTNSQANSFA